MKGPESGAIVTTKMEFFDQVTLCLGILEMQTNALVVEASALYGEQMDGELESFTKIAIKSRWLLLQRASS